eukprot:g16609.t1
MRGRISSIYLGSSIIIMFIPVVPCPGLQVRSPDINPRQRNPEPISSVARPATEHCKSAPALRDEVVDGVKGVFMVIADWGFHDGFSHGARECQHSVAKLAKEWLKAKYDQTSDLVRGWGGWSVD